MKKSKVRRLNLKISKSKLMGVFKGTNALRKPNGSRHISKQLKEKSIS